jgi:hypothetical protein
LLSAYATEPIPHSTHFNPEDGGSMSLGNFRIRLKYYTVWQPRKSDVKYINTLIRY